MTGMSAACTAAWISAWQFSGRVRSRWFRAPTGAEMLISRASAPSRSARAAK